jgi:pSer/pThr/pTyr-binding forkhead associated (FHA) protein
MDSMEAKLVITKGKANKAEVKLKLPTTIGRSREADLTIAHPMVSRQHCQLF